MGQDLPPGSISMMNLFDDQTLEKIAESVGLDLAWIYNVWICERRSLSHLILIRLVKLIMDHYIRLRTSLRVRTKSTSD